MHGKVISRALILYLGLVLFLMSPPLTAKPTGDILSIRQEIESLIEAGQLTDAQIQIDKLKADYSQDSDLPDALYQVAERYRWTDNREQAKQLYQQIVQDYPGRAEATKARLGLAREEIMSLVISHNYSLAEEKTNKLVNDFEGHIDLPDALYWIAERYRWEHKWEHADDLYRRVIQNHSDSSFVSRANLGIARARVLSLLVAKDYIRAEQAAYKLADDYKGHQDLPETLYWIAEGFRWGGEYKKAKSLYRQIIENYPDSPYSSRARLGLARAEVLSLIISRNYDKAEEILARLVGDFSGHPDLPDTLYWIADRYRWSDRYEKAKNIYQQIIQEYPRSSAADQARQQFRVVIQGMDVFALIESGQEQIVQGAIDQLMTNPDNEESDEISPYTVFLCGDRYYAKGLKERNEGFESEAVESFTKAINIWERMIQQLPASTSTAHACYRSANCYVDLGQYDRAIERYTRLVEDFPDYYLAWDAYFKIGRYCQKLKDIGAIDGTSADAHTKAVYELILEKYPDCPAARAAGNWLKRYAD